MADYYSLLKRAVSALPDPTAEARNSVYDRARKALFNQLRTIQPPVAEEDINAEGRALDEAIARLEAEQGAPAAEPKAAPAPAREQRPREAGPETPPAQETRVPPQPAAGRETTSAKAPEPVGATETAKTNSANAGSPKADAAKAAPAKPGKALFGALGGKPAETGDKPSASRGLFGGFGAKRAEPKPVASKADAPTPVEAPRPAVDASKTADAAKTVGPAKPTEPAKSAEPAKPAGEPARERPPAPLPKLPESVSGPRRLLAVGAVLLALVALVGGAAMYFKEKPEDLARLKPDETAGDSGGGKFAERVGEGEDASASAAKPADKAGPAIPVAQKAELWVASAQEPDKVDKIYAGTAVWRLENVGGPGEPVSSAIHGDISFPDAKAKLTLVIRKNNDATLSASHTINASFKIAPDSGLKGVKLIGPIQMRRPDAQSGEKVAGIPVPITDNNFLIGLMRGDREARNLQLMRGLMVIDLPMQLADGRAATISMEKGPSGERVFADAIDSWKR